VNTTLHHSTTHPPDTEDRKVLQIPASEELRALALADRLSFRIGLWLLRRAQRPRTVKERVRVPAEPLFLNDRHLAPGESRILLEYHMQRQLR